MSLRRKIIEALLQGLLCVLVFYVCGQLCSLCRNRERLHAGFALESGGLGCVVFVVHDGVTALLCSLLSLCMEEKIINQMSKWTEARRPEHIERWRAIT